MVEEQKKLVLSDIYEAFGDRCPPELLASEDKTMSAELGVDKNELVSECLTVGTKASTLFDGVKKGDPASKRIEDTGLSIEKNTFLRAPVGNSDLTLEATKRFVKEDPIDGQKPFMLRVTTGKEEERITLVLQKGEQRVGDITLVHDDNNEWALIDRFVEKFFRGGGVASALFKAMDNFVQAYADRTGQPQTITVDCIQPTVLAFCLNKSGFTPQTADDQAKIDAVTTGNPNLYLSFINRPDGSGKRLDFLDPCCFDSNKVPDTAPDSERTPANAYRIHLVKKYVPSKSAVTSIAGLTNERVNGAV